MLSDVIASTLVMHQNIRIKDHLHDEQREEKREEKSRSLLHQSLQTSRLHFGIELESASESPVQFGIR